MTKNKKHLKKKSRVKLYWISFNIKINFLGIGKYKKYNWKVHSFSRIMQGNTTFHSQMQVKESWHWACVLTMLSVQCERVIRQIKLAPAVWQTMPSSANRGASAPKFSCLALAAEISDIYQCNLRIIIVNKILLQ